MNPVFLLVQPCVYILSVSIHAVCIEFAVKCAWIHVQLWILTSIWWNICLLHHVDAVNNFTIPASKCLMWQVKIANIIILEPNWGDNRRETFIEPIKPIPIGSMYGIFTYIWHEFMVNVRKYTIHGSYGIQASIYSILFGSPKRQDESLEDATTNTTSRKNTTNIILFAGFTPRKTNMSPKKRLFQ